MHFKEYVFINVQYSYLIRNFFYEDKLWHKLSNRALFWPKVNEMTD